MKKFLLLLLITLSVNANNFVYMTEEAEHSNEYNYMITLKTEGGWSDTGHSWIKFQSFKEPSKNTALGFYPAKGDAIYSGSGRIQKEFGGSDDSLRINVTKRQFNNALLVANYFKGSCLTKTYKGCISWKAKKSYQLFPYNKFVCTTYTNAILKAIDMPLPSINYTAPKWHLYNIVRYLGVN